MTKTIVHICLSKGWGGLEMYPIRTGQAQIARGWKVLGICLAGTPVAQRMKKAGLETYEVASKGEALRSVVSINAWLKKHQATLVHSHKSGDMLLSAVLNLLTKRYSYFTEHMGGNSSKRDLYHKLVYAHLDRLFSISDATYARNIKNLPMPIERVHRNWLGTEVIEPVLDAQVVADIRQEFAIPADAKVVGTLGRLDSGKGVLETIHAFEHMVKAEPNCHLLIVGGLLASQGSDEAYVATLKQTVKDLGLESQVHFTGFQSRVPELLAAMDVVCMLSWNEAFGLTLIEAMMAQKAVVASNSGAYPEILEDDALTVNYQDAKQVAEKVLALFDDDKYQVVAKRLRERALEHFSLDGHLDRLEQWYQ
ncbi:glycosyltransferase family 4 protein [Vibrio sp. SCSIO 43136]|uniref:glycosyltransferase family 4 protein n=1 Tax=Vibrio sp. SCSIO 43136 TaxID=2819101 RepID=UPI002074E266|nr:glycosyltransferase family 4 protein [Vibrio sp. SCSIO 43136]USD65171.1 glycosyltransferase family 4 protein [Vibrio sp. SCSIO 43136]